jgi:hypothetical protein
VTAASRHQPRVREGPGQEVYAYAGRAANPFPAGSAGQRQRRALLQAGDEDTAQRSRARRTVAGGPADGQLAGGGRHRRTQSARATATKPGLPISAIALSAAVGVLVVAAAYAAGRLGYASSRAADLAYWLGQALIVIPVASRLLSRNYLGASETVALVIVLTLAEFLLKICYSPLGLSFVDELAHWRSTVNLLHTGKLFTVNYMLPISPQYPGLEEVTSSLTSLTGLPVFASGLIVAGVAHLLFVCLLYLLFRHISGRRLAGVAVLIYSSNPDLPSFDSMFVYQTLAVAFFGLALVAAWQVTARRTAGHRAGWLTVAVLAISATVVTHHVTSFMLVAALALVSAGSLLAGDRRSAAWLAVLALASSGAVACWVLFVAPDTVSYFQPTFAGVLRGLRALLVGRLFAASSASAGPLGNQVLAAAATAVVSVLLPIGWWQVWRHSRRKPWLVAMAIGSASWYAIIVIRLTTADGSELAGRAATFVFIPVGLIAAIAGVRLLRAGFFRWRTSVVAAAALMTALTLLFDGLVNGWPPYWERLPGPHQVAGFERSVGPEEIAAGLWTLEALGPGNRFATDLGNYPALGSYGDQNPLRDAGYLYTSPRYTQQDALRAQAEAVRYVLVDWRLAHSLPVDGKYFPVDPNAGKYTHPLPVGDLVKFGHIPGAARIYDSGNIVIYDLRGARYAP